MNVQSGAQTPLAGILSTLLVIFSLLFLTPVVYFIPRALLASIVLVAIVDIIDYKQVKILWKMDQRRDMALLLVSFVATLAIGILQGLLIGVGASLLVIIYRIAYPPVTELGRLIGSTTYINKNRFPQATTVPGLAVVRVDGPLCFANSEHIRKRLRSYITSTNSNTDITKWIVLDCSSMVDIDSTAIRALKEVFDELHNNNLQLFFACVKGPIRDALRKCGIVGLMGQDHFFWRVHDAVEHYYTSVLLQEPPHTEEELKNVSSHQVHQHIS